MKKIYTIIIFFITTNLIFSEIYDGHLLYSPNSGGGQQGIEYYARLIDNDGNIIHEWNGPSGCASMPYLRQDSILVYPYRVSNPTMEAGGVGGGVQYISWNGDVLWDYVLSDDNYQHHHDVEPLPNGNVLMIAWERKYSTEAYEMGRQTTESSLNQMWSESIFEVEAYTGNIVWKWHLWDHLVQDIGTEYGATYGTISDHPELLDINYGTVGGGGGPGGANGDWRHHNAIAYNINLDQIVISSRHGDEILVIDHSTTTEQAASHSGGNSGKGGDFLYRWGNPQSYDRGSNAWHDLDGQHSVNWIPEGYPGAGNLILFNNGYSNNQSAVFEIATPIDENGNYYIEDGQPFGPSTTTWQAPSTSFNTDVQGGAFRLPNGNTMVTEADDAHIFEISEDGDILWQFNPNDIDMIARATKYPLNYLEQSNPGDINSDEVINILDVVLLVNIILGTSDFISSADLNGDGIGNILDVVLLVNIILGN